MSDEPDGMADDVFGSIIDDPETQAWTFAAVGPDGKAVTYGESYGNEDSYESICATVLIQFASASQRDETEFIRSVVQEYNRRKESAYGHSGENTNGGDN